jgi:outer membrane protein TolC
MATLLLIRSFIFTKLLLVPLMFMGLTEICNSASFTEKAAKILEGHARVLAAEASANSLREAARISYKEWYPILSIATSKGKEIRDNATGTADTRKIAADLNLTLTQPVFDSGARSYRTKAARMRLDQAKDAIELVKQSLLLEAISAQVSLISSIKLVKYALDSVANIKRQAQLENARVEKGAGLSTDVLQAKVQLAGAESRYFQSINALKTSRNRYKAVFGETEFNEQTLKDIAIPEAFIPTDIEDVVSMALDRNLQLKSLDINRRISKTEIDLRYSEQLLPTIDLVVERKYKRDIGGDTGKAREDTIKLQANFSLNLGFSSLNSLKLAKYNYAAISSGFQDASALIEENARNSYDQYQAVLQNFKILQNQANISSEFLKLARKERKLGKRSLIDVLSGETAEINAKSDAESANFQLIISAYSILSVIGILKLEAVKLVQ